MGNLIEAFIILFVIMDPVGNLPFFISLSKGIPRKEMGNHVNNCVLVAGIIIFSFLFFGLAIFDFFGIDIKSFQIAGGIILLLIGIVYVFGLSNKYIKIHGNGFTVPISTPLLAGPGSITTTLILVNEHGVLITAMAALLTLLATWIVLANSFRIYRFLGEQWINIISRLMGIILAAIAVEFIINGTIGITNAKTN